MFEMLLPFWWQPTQLNSLFQEPDPLSITYTQTFPYPNQELQDIGNNIVGFMVEGQMQYAYFLLPLSDKPEGGWPVVIFAHGDIPPEQYRAGQQYQTYITALTKEGFAVLAPDYRGHGN